PDVPEMPDWKTTRLRTSHAFHSRLMDPMLDDFRAVVETLTFHTPDLAYVSTVGAQADWTDPSYWVRQVREPVRFADAVTRLGHVHVLELGPDTVLTSLIPAVTEAHERDGITAVAALRRDRDEVTTLLTAVGTLFTAGVEVDWTAVLGDGPRADLPTYAFQHRRFWPRARTGPAGDAAGLGLTGTGHPLAGAAVELPSGERVLTGRLSTAAYPWLTDHTIGGRTVVPGTALAELALAAGHQAGLPVLDELLLQAPLTLDAGEPAEVRVTLAVPDAGRSAVTIHSRTGTGEPWTLHAAGLLTETADPVPELPAGTWPPVGAQELDISGFYATAAAGGLDYGPAFQGLRRVWRLADTVYAEAAIDDVGRGYALHPALFDAVLHAIGAGGALPAEGGARLPFGFTGLRITGKAGTALRAEITPAPGTDTVRITLADPSGLPVAAVESLSLRPVAATSPADRLLYTVDWTPSALTPDPVRPAVLTLGGDLPAPAPILVVDATAPGTARNRSAALLILLQTWLADPGWADSRLVVRTSGAVGADVTDPDGAALWGLVRSAQSEHPDRFHLVDGPADLFYPAPEVLVRDGVAGVPRLSRIIPGAPVDLGDGAVVVTGATGTLGELVARHLVRAHGVQNLILLSRSGRGLVIEDARVRAVACDVADEQALRAALAGERITAVVHAAGVLDDGALESLTPARLDTVFRAKVDAVRALAEVTREQPLTAFVLYSSAAGLFGTGGQANYAAANAFLDGYATTLRATGVPALSLAWGLWDAGMGETADLARMRRGGILPLTAEQGLAAFDAALGAGVPVIAPLALDPAALGQAAAAGMLPPLLAGLIRTPRQRAEAPAGPSLGQRLTGLSEDDQDRLVLDVVRDQVAAVLGHDSGAAVPAGRAFSELGFDSLTAVELRNRLGAATGLRLPSTLVFDYPNAGTLAAHLVERLRPAVVSPMVALLAELDQLERGLLDTSADEQDRSRVTARLHGLLAAWQGTGTAPAGGASLADELESASDDQMFDLLGKEFGIS
ncbi:SDR family NAD(P)-dependent oxidoreductase, partial [Actinoplanes derwentensis]